MRTLYSNLPVILIVWRKIKSAQHGCSFYFVESEGDFMKIKDHLTNEQQEKLNQIPKKKKRKKEERVDWVDIMGMNRETYKRHNGAIRRK